MPNERHHPSRGRDQMTQSGPGNGFVTEAVPASNEPGLRVT
jgi:hypothetical protein